MSRLLVFTEPGKARIIIPVALMVAIAVLSVGELVRNISDDFGVYWSNGWFISQGMLPYEDFFTHKTPFFFVVIAGWIKAFGTSLFSAWLLKFSIGCLLTATTYFSARKMDLSKPISLVAAGLVAFYTAGRVIEYNDNGIIVVFASIFETIAIASAYLISRQRGNRKIGLIAGIAFMLGIATRQTTVFLLPFIVFAILVTAYRKNKSSTLLGIGWMFIGISVTAALLLITFVAFGGRIESVFRQLIEFNQIYLSGSRQSLPHFVYDWATYLTAPERVIISLVLATAVVMAIRKKLAGTNQETVVFLLLVSIGFLISLLAQGQHRVYYTRQLVPVAAIISAILYAGLYAEIRALRSVPIIRSFLLISLLVIGLVGPLKREFESQLTLVREYRSKTETMGFGGSERSLSTFLTEHHGSNEMKILIISGGADEIYAYTNSMPVSVYKNRIALVWPNYLSDREFSDWVDEVKQSDFDYVISFSIESEIGDINTPKTRFGKAVVSITQYLDRVDYPNDELAIYQQQP